MSSSTKVSNPNLSQGQELLEFNEEYVRVLQPHLRELQLSTSPRLISVVEALSKDASTNAKHTKAKEHVSKLEKEFNKTLGEYARTNDQINELLLRRHHKGLDTYNGMIVTTDGDKDYVYVNDYGFTHKYPKESSHATPMLDKSCEKLKRAQLKQSVLERLERGRAMVPGEPCGVAGKNINKGGTDEHAWVSIDGLKHVYPSHVWKKKSDSCHVPVITLTESAYNAIPAGTSMTTTSECERGSGVTPALWDRLYKLNGKLTHLTNELTKEINTLVAADEKLTRDLIDHKQQLANHTDSLGRDRHKIQSLQRDFQTVIGESEDSRIQMRSNWLHYLVWIILAVTVVSIVIHTARMNDPGRAAQIVVLIAALIIVYGIASWIDRYYL